MGTAESSAPSSSQSHGSSRPLTHQHPTQLLCARSALGSAARWDELRCVSRGAHRAGRCGCARSGRAAQVMAAISPVITAPLPVPGISSPRCHRTHHPSSPCSTACLILHSSMENTAGTQPRHGARLSEVSPQPCGATRLCRRSPLSGTRCTAPSWRCDGFKLTASAQRHTTRADSVLEVTDLTRGTQIRAEPTGAPAGTGEIANRSPRRSGVCFRCL